MGGILVPKTLEAVRRYGNRRVIEMISIYLVAYFFSSSRNLRDADVVRWLREHGADPNIRDRRGYTALDYASYQYSLEVVICTAQMSQIPAPFTVQLRTQ